MPKTNAKKAGSSTAVKTKPGSNTFRFRDPETVASKTKTLLHVFEVGDKGTMVVCDTDTRGYQKPRGRSVLEIVVNASEGFIPLWAKNTTLRWRFNEASIQLFENPAAAKTAIRKIFGEALLAWGDAVPVKFAERDDAWDFEIVINQTEKCSLSGCVLASAFFPDAGRHKLRLYPTLFGQTDGEQIETLVHEIGHAFGLRHFFAKVKEASAASEIFGVHNEFSIMNYGAKSKLTDADKADLKDLYEKAWSGELTEINGTPIKFMSAFHTTGESPESMTGITTLNPAFQPRT